MKYPQKYPHFIARNFLVKYGQTPITTIPALVSCKNSF